MSEPPAPEAPRPDDPAEDARDPRVATWLAVDPLDEVTRARLVRAAVAGAAEAPAETSPRARRWVPVVAVAAVLVAFLVVAGVVLLSGGDDTTTTASRAPAKESIQDSRGANDAAGSVAPEAAALPDAEAATTLPSIGDLGDVSTEARLARAASAVRLVPDAPPVTVRGCAAATARSLGTPVAAGTGTIDGRPARIVVVDRPVGTRAVVAVRGARCTRVVSATVG